MLPADSSVTLYNDVIIGLIVYNNLSIYPIVVTIKEYTGLLPFPPDEIFSYALKYYYFNNT